MESRWSLKEKIHQSQATSFLGKVLIATLLQLGLVREKHSQKQKLAQGKQG
jgi:hypothetical protein